MTMDSQDFSAEELARGEALFKGTCAFVKGVVRIDDLPKDGRPEVAFAGRSNVGKSSVINSLTGRTSLARVSVTRPRSPR
jgi:GTP-binding protein